MVNWIRSVIIGLCTAVAGLILTVAEFGHEYERDVGLAWMFTIRGPLPSPPEVAVIGLNSKSGKHLGLPALPRDWPRSAPPPFLSASGGGAGWGAVGLGT